MTGIMRVDTMEYSNRSGHRLAALFCVAALLTGCGGSPVVRHYLVAPAAGTTPAATLPAGTVIGLGPVSVPDYLSRPQMAVRNSASTIEYRDGDRWAEPFADNVRRVLKENLAAALPGTVVRAYPWPRSEAVDRQVVIEITRFDADATGNVTLAGRWTLRRDTADAQPVEGTFSVTQQAPHGGATAVAEAHGVALGNLASRLAEALVRSGP